MKNKLNKSVEWCPVCGDEDTYESAEGVFVASCKSCGRPLMLCEKCFERYGNDRPCGEGCPAGRAYDELLEAWERERVGRRVRWEDPDGGACSGEGVVIGLNGDAMVVRKDDGGIVVVPYNELKWL